MRATRVNLADHVKRLWRQRGWSQLQLAEASGLYRTHVSRRKDAADNASIDTVDHLAFALAVEAAALVGAPAAEQVSMSLRRLEFVPGANLYFDRTA